MNREDKELIELAAYAIGLDVRCVDGFRGLYIHQPHKMPYYWKEFNPLANKADAFDLMVKLRMSVDVEEYENSTYAYAGDVPREFAIQSWAEDNEAATMRAITRASAAIGKQMKERQNAG